MEAKVLIIDDEEWFLEPIFERLDYYKIQFDYCMVGSEGLDLVEKGGYSLIILDLRVPLGDGLTEAAISDRKANHSHGITILEKIRDVSPNIPVICYTVLSDEATKRKISALAAIHIIKANNESELFEAILSHIKPDTKK